MRANIFYILTVILFIGVSTANAQAPQKFNYQGVARNAAGLPLVSQSIGLRLTILDGTSSGPAQYSETHTVTTNAYGLYNVAVGGGTVGSGSMAAVTWASGDKYLKVEIDPAGGTSYTDLGATQLLSVPYALAGPGTKVSAFQPTGCQNLASVTNTMTKIGDMGTFTKVDGGGFIEINVQTIITATFGTATGVVFEVRVDNTATTIGNATALLRSGLSNLPVSITGVFTTLGSGTHTVSLWARAVNGTATNAYWDPGCFNSFGTNNVLVKEYK